MSTLNNITEGPAWVPTHPGELVGEFLKDAGVSQTEAARRLHVSRQTVHKLVTCRQGVTPEMAFRLGRLFGNGPGLWLRMQVAHDLRSPPPAVQAALEEIEGGVRREAQHPGALW
jgi:addiction module HigA family antidote